MTRTRHIALEGAFNVRDLGGYKTASGGETPWSTFLRADALHELTPADVETLLDMGLSTVIDLRSNLEITYQPSRFAVHDDVSYNHIPLFDGLAPVDAFKPSAGEFSLSARYIDAVDTCQPALVKVMHTIANAPEGLVLFNCTAGKDRTGIIAAALLSIAGVSSEDIITDYALTAEIAGPLMQRLKMAAIQRGLEETTATRLLSSERETMDTFLRHVESRYSGFNAYFERESVNPGYVSQIKERLAIAA